MKTTNNGPELRFVEGSSVQIEYRAEGEKEPVAFTGTAIVTDKRSKNLGGFVEIISREALDAADMTDVVGLFNHDNSQLLGRTTSGTMTLKRNASGGLDYRIAYDPQDPDHVRVMRKILRGDVVGSSFAFRVAAGGDSWDKEDTDTSSLYVRTVRKIQKVYDVSPVTDPAYADTSAAKRSLEQRMGTMKMGKKKKKRSESAAVKAERRFLEDMIPHHEMALNMAEEVLQKAENEDIRAFAQSIIDGQGAEIDQMKQWLGELDKQRSAPAVPLSIRKRQLDLLTL